MLPFYNLCFPVFSAEPDSQTNFEKSLTAIGRSREPGKNANENWLRQSYSFGTLRHLSSMGKIAGQNEDAAGS